MAMKSSEYWKKREVDRIWMYQGMLKAELEGLLASGLIRGQNPKKLAKHLEKRFGVSAYNAQRLMTTELARVQTEAQKQSFIRNGFDEYVYVACTKGDVCPICKGLDDKHFKVDDMMPGENAPPMHPNCHCSTAAYMDNEAYEEWLNSYQEHGLNFEDWKASKESEKLVDKLSKYEKDFEKLTEGYSYDEFVNDFGSVEEGFEGSDANEIKKARVVFFLTPFFAMKYTPSFLESVKSSWLLYCLIHVRTVLGA